MVVQPLPSLGCVESKREKQRALDVSSKLSGLLKSATEKSAHFFPSFIRILSSAGLNEFVIPRIPGHLLFWILRKDGCWFYSLMNSKIWKDEFKR